MSCEAEEVKIEAHGDSSVCGGSGWRARRPPPSA
jgi:hypothetical protein